MMHSKEATLATLEELEAAVRDARRAVMREGFDLSHRGHAARIGLAEALSARLTRRFAEALHAVNLMAIGHDLVDSDYADIIAAIVADACADEYEPAMHRQRRLSAGEGREAAGARRLAA